MLYYKSINTYNLLRQYIQNDDKDEFDAIISTIPIEIINQNNGIPLLHIAIRFNRPDFVKKLIDCGADINMLSNGLIRTLDPCHIARMTPLMLSFVRGNKIIVELLLQNGVNLETLNDDNESAIFYAIHSIKMTKILLQHDIDVNVVNNYHKNVLFFVEDPEVLKLLLSSGIEYDIYDQYNNSPIIRKTNISVVDMLSNRINNINHKNNSGEDILYMYCVDYEYYDDHIYNIVELLISKGANINQLYGENKNLLFFATNVKILEILIKNSININHRDNANNTCLDDVLIKLQNKYKCAENQTIYMDDNLTFRDIVYKIEVLISYNVETTILNNSFVNKLLVVGIDKICENSEHRHLAIKLIETLSKIYSWSESDKNMIKNKISRLNDAIKFNHNILQAMTPQKNMINLSNIKYDDNNK